MDGLRRDRDRLVVGLALLDWLSGVTWRVIAYLLLASCSPLDSNVTELLRTGAAS